jgi:folate-binding protein YgfZ
MTPHSESGHAVFVDLSGRAKLRVTGADRIRFLNGQITNDPRKATETSAIEACVLNAKGKIDAHIYISALGESFLLDAAPDLRETLKLRLERYVIADDVEIEDVTDQFCIFHALSPQAPLIENARILSVRRFAEPGWDVWVDATQYGALFEQISSRRELCDSDAAEVMRIEQGIPRWGRELTNEIIPMEANLEQRVIDYEKGCYIGQEVISRIKMSGQTNKRLSGLISLDNVPLQREMKLAAPLAPEKEVGWITSAATSKLVGKQIALAYVKRGFNNADTELNAFAPKDSESNQINEIRVKVVPLPFV